MAFDSTPLSNDSRYASVAVIWNQRDELLFIERAINPRDPWSGQMSFPGGRQEAEEGPVETAIRETYEEIGVRLPKESFSGFLPSVRGRKNKKMLDFYIHPAVFRHDTDSFSVQPSEVQAAYWIPLAHFLDPTRVVFADGEYPFLKTRNNRVWGLSFFIAYRFLNECSNESLLEGRGWDLSLLERLEKAFGDVLEGK